MRILLNFLFIVIILKNIKLYNFISKGTAMLKIKILIFLFFYLSLSLEMLNAMERSVQVNRCQTSDSVAYKAINQSGEIITVMKTLRGPSAAEIIGSIVIGKGGIPKILDKIQATHYFYHFEKHYNNQKAEK